MSVNFGQWARCLLGLGPKGRRGNVFSCVIDAQPRFHDQGALWVSALLHHQRVPPSSIFVHLVQPADSRFAAWLARQGVGVVPVEPFDARSPHCNKLRQLETDFGEDVEQVVLMDCDTVWLGGQPLPVAEPVAAKLVDRANPAPEILSRVFAASGLGEPQWSQVGIPRPGEERRTDRNNCNGGFYILRLGECRSALAEAWPRWARWCLDRRELFGRSIHFDQVSYALSARELGIETRLLGPEWNYPTHYPDWPLPDLSAQVIHYHRRYAPDLSVLPVGVPRPDAAIARFNARMSDVMRCYRAEFPAV